MGKCFIKRPRNRDGTEPARASCRSCEGHGHTSAAHGSRHAEHQVCDHQRSRRDAEAHAPTDDTHRAMLPLRSCLATCSVLKASGLQDSPGSLSGGPSTDHVLEHPLRVSLCFVQSLQLCLSDLVPPSATLSFRGWPVTCCLVFLCLQQNSVGTAA